MTSVCPTGGGECTAFASAELHAYRSTINQYLHARLGTKVGRKNQLKYTLINQQEGYQLISLFFFFLRKLQLIMKMKTLP